MKSEGRRSHKDHNQKLFSLQERYLETRQPKTLERIHSVIQELARNLVRNYFRDRGLFINREDLEVKACDIASLCIERYLRDPDFKVKRSFSGWVRNGAFLKIMFKDIHHDRAEEFNEFQKIQAIWDRFYFEGENPGPNSEAQLILGINTLKDMKTIGELSKMNANKDPLLIVVIQATIEGIAEPYERNFIALMRVYVPGYVNHQRKPNQAVAVPSRAPERKIHQPELGL